MKSSFFDIICSLATSLDGVYMPQAAFDIEIDILSVLSQKLWNKGIIDM